MDHYKVLGLTRNATKDEIKEAFRKLAMQFHPDKHSHSPNSVKDGATLRFKQVSEAYEVLMDDRKRAHFNLRYSNNNNNNNGRTASGFNSYGYGYGYNSRSKTNNSYGFYSRGVNGDGLVSKLEIAFRFLTTRSGLLNLAFAGALLGGTFIIDTSGDTLWKMHNPGKSFEDAVESIEKAKAVKDKIVGCGGVLVLQKGVVRCATREVDGSVNGGPMAVEGNLGFDSVPLADFFFYLKGHARDCDVHLRLRSIMAFRFVGLKENCVARKLLDRTRDVHFAPAMSPVTETYLQVP
ncbi:hypothetical protein CsSME_00046011 [Camellia sinensis var. sinensis]